MGFNVVFQSKPHTGQPGIMTWSCFENRESFLRSIDEFLKNSDVVALDVSDEEAVAITRKTPVFARYYAYLNECWSEEHSEFSLELFKQKIQIMEMCEGTTCPECILHAAAALDQGLLTEMPPIEAFFMQ